MKFTLEIEIDAAASYAHIATAIRSVADYLGHYAPDDTPTEGDTGSVNLGPRRVGHWVIVPSPVGLPLDLPQQICEVAEVEDSVGPCRGSARTICPDCATSSDWALGATCPLCGSGGPALPGGEVPNV